MDLLGQYGEHHEDPPVLVLMDVGVHVVWTNGVAEMERSQKSLTPTVLLMVGGEVQWPQVVAGSVMSVALMQFL